MTTAGTSIDVSSSELRHALKADQLWVAFQPKVDCATRHTKAFELLARWTHPSAGDVPPAIFIPVAESSGLIGELTLAVIRRGLEWVTGFQHDNLLLCVNLSTRLFDNDRFLAQVTTLCKAFTVPSRNIIFELSEARLPLDSGRALAFITRLRIQGFNVAIDDVGSGYSSLVRLSTLPYSEMKIDRCVVRNADSSEKQKLVLEYLVNVGHSIGLAVVAEGVEDEESLELVESVGCDLVQGNYIGRPMRGTEARAWYRGHA